MIVVPACGDLEREGEAPPVGCRPDRRKHRVTRREFDLPKANDGAKGGAGEAKGPRGAERGVEVAVGGPVVSTGAPRGRRRVSRASRHR